MFSVKIVTAVVLTFTVFGKAQQQSPQSYTTGQPQAQPSAFTTGQPQQQQQGSQQQQGGSQQSAYQQQNMQGQQQQQTTAASVSAMVPAQQQPSNESYTIGQMPIECITWMDCYQTREPLLAEGDSWRYTTKGCTCEHDEAYGELNLFCGIERLRPGELKVEVVPCVYCGAECDTPDFFTRNHDALVAWQNRRTARFRPVSPDAQVPADTNKGPDTVGTPLNLYPAGQAPQGQDQQQQQSQQQGIPQQSGFQQQGTVGQQQQQLGKQVQAQGSQQQIGAVQVQPAQQAAPHYQMGELPIFCMTDSECQQTMVPGTIDLSQIILGHHKAQQMQQQPSAQTMQSQCSCVTNAGVGYCAVSNDSSIVEDNSTASTPCVYCGDKCNDPFFSVKYAQKIVLWALVRKPMEESGEKPKQCSMQQQQQQVMQGQQQGQQQQQPQQAQQAQSQQSNQSLTTNQPQPQSQPSGFTTGQPQQQSQNSSNQTTSD